MIVGRYILDGAGDGQDGGSGVIIFSECFRLAPSYDHRHNSVAVASRVMMLFVLLQVVLMRVVMLILVVIYCW